jgi:phosphoglycerate kinase
MRLAPKRSLRDLAVGGRRVLVRVDFNVPLDGAGRITDDRRITEALPTIAWLRRNGARTILASHLGRPKGQRDPRFSLEPVAVRLGHLIGSGVPLLPDCVGSEVAERVRALSDGDVALLENVRFHPEEERDDPAFAAGLAELAECYVNDAFGAAHRAHASTHGAAFRFEDRVAGLLLMRELEVLSALLEAPERPFVAIIGGAKVGDKLEVLEALLERVDALLVGGAMAFTFLGAQGARVGGTLVEPGRYGSARRLVTLAREHGTVLSLPTDAVIAPGEGEAEPRTVEACAVPDGWRALDVGPLTLTSWATRLAGTRTLFWNGPVGVFERQPFDAGTRKVARLVGSVTARGGTTVAAGGDSAAALDAIGAEGSVSHISTGGGAALEFLAGRTLPGVEVLEDAPVPGGGL